MQQFFLGVLLNMLCELILTWKLIILSILHVMAHIHKDKSVISSIPTSFEIRNRLLFVINTIIPTQCFYRFFGEFDWSVGKIKCFLHFNKNPCV